MDDLYSILKDSRITTKTQSMSLADFVKKYKLLRKYIRYANNANSN
jgi:hypothetical protein